MARSTGVSRWTVSQIAKKAGIPVSSLTNPELIDRIFALRDEGKSVTQVAAETHVSESTVRRAYAHVNANTYKRSWWETTGQNRTLVLRKLDDGQSAKDIARELQLPLETVRGIANQSRVARDTYAIELLRQGRSPEEVGQTLGIRPEYVNRLRQRLPEGTHDIHWSPQQNEAAMEMFREGRTQEEVAEKMGISLWQAYNLANEFRTRTMDSVMPRQLQDIVNALNNENYAFTTGDLAKATGLPESTVTLVEHELETGAITARPGSPTPGTSSGTGEAQPTYQWVPPLTDAQATQAIRAIGNGESLDDVARQLNVDPAAIQRLYEADTPLIVDSDDPVPHPLVPQPPAAAASAPAPVAQPISEATKLEIRKFAADQFSVTFIASFFEVSQADVNRILQSR